MKVCMFVLGKYMRIVLGALGHSVYIPLPSHPNLCDLLKYFPSILVIESSHLENSNNMQSWSNNS